MQFQAARSPASGDGAVLIVDDDADSLDLLEGMLARTSYSIVRAQAGPEALALLQEDPFRFDAVLLDRMMPGMTGLDVLRTIKDDEQLFSIPVIMQTAAGGALQVAEGLEAGAHYYLTKPYERGQLLPIVRGAVQSHRRFREMRRRLESHCALGLLVTGEFRLQTLEEAHELAVFLARATRKPSHVALGLYELMANAVEHGCYRLGYEGKRDALVRGRLPELLARHAAQALAQGVHATVRIEREPDRVTFVVSDPGAGFRHHDFGTYNPLRYFEPNGRGIQVARELSFSEVVYNDRGNEVRASVGCASAVARHDG